VEVCDEENCRVVGDWGVRKKVPKRNENPKEFEQTPVNNAKLVQG